MSFSGLVPQGVIDLIANRSRRGDPTQPWSEAIPAIASNDPSTAIHEPGERPVNDVPQDNPAVQASQPPIIPTFTRGNDIQGMDEGNNATPTPAPGPQQKFTPPSVTQPSNASAFTFPDTTPDYLKKPPVITDPNVTMEGRVRPQESQYAAGVDSNGNKIGRGSRFAAGFASTQGGIVDKLLGGFFGLVDPNSGNRAAFNRDMGRFVAEKRTDQALLDQDPLNKARIEYGVRSGLIPMETAKYIQQQNALWGPEGFRRTANESLQDIKGDQAMQRLNQRDADRLKEVGVKIDATTNKRFNERFNILRNDPDNKDLPDEALKNQAAAFVKAEDDVKMAKDKQQIAVWQDRITTNQGRLSQAAERLKIAQGNLEARRAQLEQNGQYQSQKIALDSTAKNLASVQREHTRLTNILLSQDSSADQKQEAQKQLKETEGDIADLQDQLAGKGGSAAPYSHRPKNGTTPNTPTPNTVHPNTGKAFTGPDGKKYVADEIDAQGNITKYHPQ